MEEQLQMLNKLGDSKKLQNYVQNLNLQRLCEELSEICLKKDGSATLQLIFKGFSQSALCQEKKAKISGEVLNLIKRKIIPFNLTNKLISILASEVDSLSTSHLVALTENCLKMMQNNQESDDSVWWKDLLPQLLNVIVTKNVVEHNGTIMSGEEYKNEIVTTICMNNWKGSLITSIAAMFIDMPLTSEEHLKVVNKLCKSIKDLKLNEIPPLTHQILQLTKEQNSIQLFMTLADYFDATLYQQIGQDNANPASQTQGGTSLKEIQIVEGTVLYHIYTAASSLGPKSVKNFLKILKDCLCHPQLVLRPFFVTLLLNVSQISYNFEEEILGTLTLAVTRSIAEAEKTFESSWITSVVPPGASAERIFDQVIKNCYRDRDRILKGLVGLGFSLLSAKSRGKESTSETAWKIGSSLLVNLVQNYPHVTDTIFQTLVNQISQVQDSTQYTDCLTRIAGKRPLSLLDCSATIMQLLGNICARLSPIVGQRVLAAILPLTKMSPSLRDNLIIFLRKALFSDQSSREMAVYGFLELLKDLRISDIRALSQSMSQNYVGITQIYSGTCQTTAGTISNEGMCLEVLTILKQVFEYHHRVKIVLYKGVYDSFYLNPKIGSNILDILKTRLDKFYKGENETPPLDFESTVALQGTTLQIKEPIAFLIFGIALIAAKIEDDGTGKSKFNEIFDVLCKNMADSDIHHFGLEKFKLNLLLQNLKASPQAYFFTNWTFPSSPYDFLAHTWMVAISYLHWALGSPHPYAKKYEGFNLQDQSPENILQQEKIRQILGVYEALIGYVLCMWKTDDMESGRNLNALFQGYSRLCNYAKGLGKTSKKKVQEDKKNTQQEKSFKKLEKAKLQTFKFSPTVLNFKCAGRLLAVLNGAPVNWASLTSTELVRSKRELHRYAYTVTLELIANASGFSPAELSRSRYMLQYISFVGRILYLRCLSRLPDVKEFDIQCAISALECFLNLLTLVCSQFKSKLSTFFTEIGIAEKNFLGQLKVVLDLVLTQLEGLLEETLEEEGKEEAQSRKVSMLLVSIALLLIDQLPRGAELQQVLTRLKMICKEKKVFNPILAKSLLALLIKTYNKQKSSGVLILDLILSLCDSMSLIDEEIDVSEHEKYSVINIKTANSCLTAVCESIHSTVQEVEWVIARCKAELSVLTFPSEETLEMKEENLYEKEKEICRHFNFAIKALTTLCTIAAPPGILADTILKEVANLYAKLILMTKYFISKFSKHHVTFLKAKFDKTIKMADIELTKNMYCFTEHVISDGSASTDEPPLKKHKKDAAALKNKVLKETKIIPKVIYEKEQFQKFVLQLSNKTKIDLELKNMMARDYRLYAKQVKEIIEKENIYTEQEFSMVDDDESTNDVDSESTQPSKKSRVESSPQ